MSHEVSTVGDEQINTTPAEGSTDKAVIQRTDQTLDRLESLQEQLISEPSVEDLETSGAIHQPRELNYPLPADFLLSVVVPVYNERSTICRIVGSVFALPLPLEVIAVDDGSTDGTRDLLEELERQHPRLQVIYQACNRGKGNALRRGLAAAKGSVVIVQDADLEYDPQDIPAVIEPLVRGEADVVYGSRFLQRRWSGSSAVHRLGNRLLTTASNLATGWKLTDMETCYKAISREVLSKIELEQDGFGFEVELTAKLARQDVRVVERPISYDGRGWDEGKKIGWRDAIHAMYCIVRYW